MMETQTDAPAQGAAVIAGGVRHRTWCKHQDATVLIVDAHGRVLRTVPLQAEDDGYFSATDSDGRAGDLYQYRFGGSQGWPDPASRWQPHGVHGPSMVVDPHKYQWRDESWQAPPFAELIIYELHLGTFTNEGTFRAAIEKLGELVALGVNAIELMPIADFPGGRNWGYDGVALYAPSRAYGHPDDLRALVDAAHGRGLAVILDVVYNHMGPDGNYLGVYHDRYLNADHQTPWGAGPRFEEAPVREFFADNAPYWMREFHLDGFRLDATHAIADFSPRHILAEISERVHALGGFLIAEDDRNDPRVLGSPGGDGLGFDGVWSDDFHHVVRVLLTGEREGYYEKFRGTPAELAETLQHGWLPRGQRARTDESRRGGDSASFPPECFVYCISNHDQTGNRAFGERLGHVLSPAAYRAASALLCLVPYTPMLFMGQEWNASTPFAFFTEHHDELGRLIAQGRRKEFEHFTAFGDPATRETIPDPQAKSSFENSKLRWDERRTPEHAAIHALYREFLHLRKTHSALRDRSRANWRIELHKSAIVVLTYDDRLTVVIDLTGGHAAPEIHRGGKLLLSSNDARFGGDPAADFRGPTTAVFERA